MSTIDPRTRAAARAARQEGSLGQLALALLMSAVALLAGASVAYGLLCATDTFRIMATNGIFDSWESPIADRWPLFLFPGILLALVAAAIGPKAAVRFGGRVGKAIIAIPFTVVGALVVAIQAPVLMTAPSEVGTKLDPTFHDPETWDAGAWIAYGAPFAAPLVVLVIAIAMVLVRLGGLRKAKRLAQLAASGLRREGTVTEVGGGSIEVNGQPLITFTVRFVDHQGTTRFVTKRKPMPVSQTPRVDQRVVVFFDPAHVDEEDRIAIGFGASDAVVDALNTTPSATA
ncbi:DUF3592 domain-containing protein [Microbacterium oxydans]|uniref:DUF3592 domain-containing protein n=1 Tax=Microbacterium oxydans TaxID=82380 RepID=UPI0024ACF256|nr:DUF3592 domain-containing protein [Microbacterium oxydans]